MSHHGDYVAGATVVFDFTTAVNGVPTVLTGTPALSIYKDSLTQTTTGITLTASYDSVTGFNHVVIDTSADGTFYATGNHFTVMISTGTVGGESVVGHVVGSFTLGITLPLIVDDATRIDASALNTASAAIGSNGSGLTEAGGTGDHLTAVPWNAAWDAEVQSEVDDALVAQRLDELLNADSDIDGLAPPTVGSVFHELMTKTAGSFTYDQTTDSLEALRDRGDAAWITATGFSTHSAADVWSVATRLLTAGTNIVLAKGTGVTGFNDLSAAQVNAEADTALADYDPPTNTEMVAAFTEIKGATWATTDTLEAIRDRGDAAWITATSVTVSDKTGFALTSAYDFAKGTVAMTESYAANGAAPTPVQALFAQHQDMMQFTISGTSKTVRKLDDATTAFIVSLNDSVNPTGAARV